MWTMAKVLIAGCSLFALVAATMQFSPFQGLLKHVKNMASDDACQCEDEAASFPNHPGFTVFVTWLDFEFGQSLNHT